MTANRDLKRRVRERQARTGESYMTALHQVRAQRPVPIPTVEFIDVTAVGTAVGLRCQIAMGPALVHRADVPATLQRFRNVIDQKGAGPLPTGRAGSAPPPRPASLVEATSRDRTLFLMRTVALHGVVVSFESGPGHREFDVLAAAGEGIQFIKRVRAGIGGVSEHGRLLALPYVPRAGAAAASAATAPGASARPPNDLALYALWLSPAFVSASRPPMLVVTGMDDYTIGDPVLDFAMSAFPDGEDAP